MENQTEQERFILGSWLKTKLGTYIARLTAYGTPKTLMKMRRPKNQTLYMARYPLL
jgi:hypothetical protein